MVLNFGKTKTMKLYTEKQVKRAMLHSYIRGVERPADYFPIEESILKEVTPIELPSDEEIEKESSKWIAPSQAFRGGAKWMKEQILNQDK